MKKQFPPEWQRLRSSIVAESRSPRPRLVLVGAEPPVPSALLAEERTHLARLIASLIVEVHFPETARKRSPKTKLK